jgi:hypothetical protein
MSVMIFWISNFKFQYGIPIALPLFSSMAIFLPDKISFPMKWTELAPYKDIHALPQILISMAILLQVPAFLPADVRFYNQYLNRAENNPSLQFYDVALDALKPLPDDGIFVYHDVRMYFPRTKQWASAAVFKPLDYEYIQKQDFEVVLIMQQRIKDYLNEGVQGVDPVEFAKSQEFYRDARTGTVKGYHLIFQNDYGLIFVRDDIYKEFYEKN